MTRRHDIDWLRVILFGLLVPYHVGVGFAEWGASVYGFANDVSGGPGLHTYLYFSHGWRLAALFVIAGIGMAFATRRSAGLGFMGARAARLLIPFLFGTLVLNTLAAFAVARMGDGGLGWHAFLAGWWGEPKISHVMHLWFLLNLALYTLICWPLFLARGALAAEGVRVRWALMACGAGIVLVELATKPYYEAIVGDGHEFFLYLGLFAAGYLIGLRIGPILDWLKRRAFWLLALAAGVFVADLLLIGAILEQDAEYARLLVVGGWAAEGVAGAFDPVPVLATLLQTANRMLWCAALLGLAARFLNRPSPVLESLNRAVFPFYVFHFPVTLIGLGIGVGMAWPWTAKFWVLTGAVYLVTAALYLLAARTGPFVALVGGRRAGKANVPG